MHIKEFIVKEENHGYIKSPYDETNYALGSGKVEEEIINLDADYSDSLPTNESQVRKFDTSNCTGEGETNILETQYKHRYKEERNFSARQLGIDAGTFPPGNDPHTVANAARKYGLVPEELSPFSDDLENVNSHHFIKNYILISHHYKLW